MHIVSSTFNQLAPSYHPAAKIYLDTITAQKKVVQVKIGP